MTDNNTQTTMYRVTVEQLDEWIEQGEEKERLTRLQLDTLVLVLAPAQVTQRRLSVPVLSSVVSGSVDINGKENR